MTDKVEMSESEKKKEDWMNAKWRPMMGWMYMVVCTMDFVIFPVLWSLLQAITKIGQITQWNPLTLQGAGLFHIAMGAVLGLAAFGRTQEKIAGANNGGAPTPALPTNFGNGGFAPTPPAAAPAPAAGGFGGSFGAPVTTPSFTAPQVVTGFGGKPAPAPAFQPEI